MVLYAALRVLTGHQWIIRYEMLFQTNHCSAHFRDIRIVFNRIRVHFKLPHTASD